MRKLVVILLISLPFTSSVATTWNEPWRNQVLQEAEYMVFGEVLYADDTLAKVILTNKFGQKINDTITIDGFYMLDLCSISGGHYPELYFTKGDQGYFFIKKGEDNNYRMPTPTSGFDIIKDNMVHATFRHSYHKTNISTQVYEMAYKVIWNKYQGNEYDLTKLNEYIEKYLSMKPAGFEEDEIDIFFNQHVALEAAYLLGIEIGLSTLEPFAKSDNSHAKISAVRAMTHCKSNKTDTVLLDFINNDNNDDFEKVMAIWAAWNRGNKKTKKTLWKLKDELSEEPTRFGGNIMDPRVCTHIPSPKTAVFNLKKKKFKTP